MSPVQPPIAEPELREMLEDAEIAIDDSVIPRLLAVVQPMRVNLRASGGRRRAAMLRGAAMSPAPPSAQGSRAGSPAVPAAGLPATGDDTPRGTVSLAKRLGVLYLATVMAMFALMAMMATTPWPSVFFAAIASALGFIAVTGRGLGRTSRSPGASRFGGIVGIIVALFFLGPLLAAGVATLLSPAAWRDWDFMTGATQLITLLAVGITVSHVRTRLRRR